jgi:hypothetical protein
MFDFLMGDTDAPATAFDVDLVTKYDSVKGVFLIGDEEVILERHWKQTGNQGKVFINGEPIKATDFSSHFLNLLNIPTLHYPQGNPLSPRTWPELSWRSLLRHIYRRQASWADLASKQPEVDKHACILLFLGIAEYLFSSEYSQLAEKQKDLYKQEVRKEEFISTLNQISKELLGGHELGVAVTTPSIDTAIQNIDAEISSLLNHRTEILDSLQEQVFQEFSLTQSTAFEELSGQWVRLQANRNELSAQIQSTHLRLRDLEGYERRVGDELSRIERAKSAGQIFRDLRVTHCPVCEQSVDFKKASLENCYLCGQVTESDYHKSSTSEQRLDFEVEQLQGEGRESQELISMVRVEINSLLSNQQNIDEELAYIQSQMRPMQTAAAAILPPEISRIDMDLGRLQERRRQLERISGALELQEDLSNQISEIEDDINVLEAEVAKISQSISFERPSLFLASQINKYLNLIKNNNPKSWTQGEIGLRLKEKGFDFTVGKKPISSLGATMLLYFLAAYNYALLALSNQEEYHYPGFSILEFPASFADGSTQVQVKDIENFILEPFIDLVGQDYMQNSQVIAVGRAFENLQHVHRIELTQIWN